MSLSPDRDDVVLRTLNSIFGIEHFRSGQEEVIANVLAGRDSLTIMPTGSGKSLTYQLPAMLLEGVTLVISPLIALMKDQVDNLPDSLRSRTRLINSSLGQTQLEEALSQLRDGQLKLCFVAPERLRDRTLLQALLKTKVSLVVIDEAHCISLWGQDFRPDYLTIPTAISVLGQPPILALTATATPAIAQQISAGIGRQLEVVRVSLFRRNLFYEVRRLANRNAKVEEMIRIARAAQGSGIVYVNSRNDVERFAAILRDHSVQAIAYHAGMARDIRAEHQDRFMRGEARVVVATVAFGMGVNKADVRFILHFNPPTSLEAYAQESGRAGRDGKPSRCILFSTASDKTRLRTFANRDALDKESLRTVYRRLKQAARGRWALLDRQQIDWLGGEDINSRVALGLLEQSGLVTRHADVARTIVLKRRSDSTDPVDEEFHALLRSLKVTPFESGATISTLDALRLPDITPSVLDGLLLRQQEFDAIDAGRAACFELLPTGPDVAAKVDKLLADLENNLERRIDQVLSYATGYRCRHQVLTAQFGESIEPCQTSCDICTGKADLKSAGSEKRVTQSQATAADAKVALDTVATLPLSVGRTGLVRILTGSPESRMDPKRTPGFGSLSKHSKGAVEKLVDRLVDTGFLNRDLNHEYKIITLTDRGRTTTVSNLKDYFTERTARATPAELDSSDKQLYGRLVAWRFETAQREGRAPFVIAQNSMLAAIAATKPDTVDQLQNVPGFGAKKAARYGDAIIAIVSSREF